MTVHAAAERLNVSPSTIYRYLHGGLLQGTRLKRVLRVYADSIERLIKEGEASL